MRSARFRLGVASAAALAAVCYLGSLTGELLYDDRTVIVKNGLVRRFEVAGILTEPSWAKWLGIGYAGYRPVTTLTFAVNHLLHGLAPVGYHAVNVAAHAAVSALLVVLLVRVGTGHAASLLAGLLFAVHPIHTEAVASVVGRAEVLATLLALLAWWLVRPENGASRLDRMLAAGVVLALAVLAKESAVAVIGVIVLADLRPRSRGPDSLLALVRGRAATWAVLVVAALAALALRSAVLHGSVGGNTKLDNVLVGEPWVARIASTFAILARYLEKLVWPLHLSADYSYRQIDLAAWSDPYCIAGLAAAAAMLAASIASRRRWPAVYVALALTTAPLAAAVMLSFLALGPTMAERHLYLASAGFCLLLALAIARVGALAATPVAARAVAAVLIVLYAGATQARNRVWRNADGFFHAMVADAPLSARSHRELANVLDERGAYDQAIAELKTALAIVPDFWSTYNLGNVLVHAGRHQEAIAAYEEALSINPDSVETTNNLGNAYSARGDEEGADPWFRKALEADPDYVNAHVNLGNSLLRRGRLQEAEAHYHRAVELEPDNAVARFNYGNCLDALGRARDAVEQFEAAIELDPARALAHVRLVGALRAAGRSDEAERARATAERLFPADARVRSLREGDGR